MGEIYLEKGVPVEVLIKPTWGPRDTTTGEKIRPGRLNCLIRRANGELVVRPFRGLRKPVTGEDYRKNIKR